MTRNARIALLAAAALVAVVAIVIIGTGGSDNSKDASTAARSVTAQATTRQATQPKAPPKPAIPVVTVSGGDAVGGVQTIAVKSGDRVRFIVTSDADHEIHLHGFDVAKGVTAGGSVSFDEKADAPGIYEFEIEDTGTKIGQVKVEP